VLRHYIGPYPIVGPGKEDYVFEEVNIGPDIDAPNKKIDMSEFFNDGADSLVVYSFMYGEHFPKKDNEPVDSVAPRSTST
jgi:predicted dithiol-disulfide oxidoreductase (DUF899 family)